MAVTIRNTVANGSLWNEWATLLNAAIFDADAQQNSYDDLLNGLANVDTSDRWAEKSVTIGGLGDFDAKTEGADAAEDTFVEGYSKLIEHITFSKTFTVSKELRDDNQISEARNKAVNMVQAYKRSRAKYLSQMITTSVGSATTMSFGTKTGIDITAPDGLALFNAAHTLKSVNGTTVSNLYSDQLDANGLVLEQLSNKMRNFVDDRGEVLGFDADTIIIPGNNAQLERLAKAIIGSEGQVGTNNNDINTQRGKWKLIVDYLWTPASGSPYILMSSKANKALDGTKFYNRTDLDVANEERVTSRNLYYNGFARWSAGFTNWRHVIMGGSSDASASSL
jgi:hypothetical protein